MNKIIKKSLALILVFAMMAFAFTGCNKKGSSKNDDKVSEKIFSSLEDVINSKKFTTEISVDVTNNGVNQKFSADVRTDGEKCAMGVEVNAAGMSVRVDDLIVTDRDAMYLNVGGIFEKIGAAASMIGLVDKSYLGITKDWAKMDISDAVSEPIDFPEVKISKELTDVIDKIVNDAVKVEGNKRIISLKSPAEAKEFFEKITNNLVANKQVVATEICKLVKEMDVDKFVDELSDIADDYGDGYVDRYDVMDLKYEINDAFNQVTEQNIMDTIDEMAEELEDEDFSDFEECTLVISVADTSDKCTIEVEAADESFEATFKVVIKSGCKKINIPDDTQDMEDLISKLGRLYNGNSLLGGNVGSLNANELFESLIET